jgi:uncharacterized protein
MNADKIIEKLNLQPHPEGGFFKETYRSKLTLPQKTITQYKEKRNMATVIYFLLKSNQKSAFHRLKTDEFWYYHQGSPLNVYIIYPDGNLQTVTLGNDFSSNQTPQLLLPSGTWFAAKCTAPQHFTLISCSVSPGFDFNDFELAERDKLVKEFPNHQQIITELT